MLPADLAPRQPGTSVRRGAGTSVRRGAPSKSKKHKSKKEKSSSSSGSGSSSSGSSSGGETMGELTEPEEQPRQLTPKEAAAEQKKADKVLAAQRRLDKAAAASAEKTRKLELAKENKVAAASKALATKALLKIRRALGLLKITVSSPQIVHVPQHTVAPLAQVISDWENKIQVLNRVVAGRTPWGPSMGDFNPKEGKAAEKPVLVMVGALDKFHSQE